MSISRLLHEFRPLFRMLEEPLTRSSPTFYGLPHRSFLVDPFFASPTTLHPAVDLAEEGDNYIVEAELPGVKKENIDITVGDGGRTLTIQGRTFNPRLEPSESTAGTSTQASSGEGGSDTQSSQLTTERLYSGTSSFMRTVWLPRSIDSSKITAKLADGVLTLKAPKMEDKQAIKITVE